MLMVISDYKAKFNAYKVDNFCHLFSQNCRYMYGFLPLINNVNLNVNETFNLQNLRDLRLYTTK